LLGEGQANVGLLQEPRGICREVRSVTRSHPARDHGPDERKTSRLPQLPRIEEKDLHSENMSLSAGGGAQRRTKSAFKCAQLR
jgi:hypothetical protein